MCEANAYLLKDGQEEKVFENVDRLQFEEEGGLLLEDIFGRRLLLNARIKELALVDHKIILEEIESE